MARNYYAFHKYMTLIKSYLSLILSNFIVAKLYIIAKKSQTT